MATPADWYPDPQNPALQRYWDGSRWTEHTHPAAPQQPVTSQQHQAVPKQNIEAAVPSGQSRLNVTTSYIWLSFLLSAVKPMIVIDRGRPIEAAWGNQSFTIAPGQHYVSIYFPWLFFPQAGANEVLVNVNEGQVSHVSYRAPWLMFLKGKMTVGVS